VPLIAKSIAWSGEGRWVEPFVGSGAVAFNVAPQRAVLADANKHIIRLHQAIQSGEMTSTNVKSYLEIEGIHLLDRGEEHYYAVRDRFNEEGSPFDFLFLSRSCFNGMMRFNKKGGFNVPFCRKPERFRQALVTKICNQVNWAAGKMAGKDWDFVCQDWRATLADTHEGDMVYADPPYVGRHTDYFNQFDEEESEDLARALLGLPCDFALSNWVENKYRRNEYVDKWFSEQEWRTMSHFYHVGPSEENRNEMTEVVILSKGAAAPPADAVEELEPQPLFELAEAFDG
jgi:DNA adenine methylase